MILGVKSSRIHSGLINSCFTILHRKTLGIDLLFDIKKWGEFAALTDVFYAHHSMRCHNVRMYFNSTTNKIETIAWDPFLVEVL